MSLNERSRKNLDGVHRDLVAVVERAREKADFLVTEGLRTKERQRSLVKAGKSQTMNSRHLYGLAVDLCDCDGCYDVPDMQSISRAMKSAAAELGIPIKWGGDWKTFKDTPHFELDRAKYPDSGKSMPWTLRPRGPTVTTLKGLALDTGLDVGSMAAPGIVPQAPLGLVSSVAGWQNAAETVSAFVHSPVLYLALSGIVLYAVICHFVPRFAERKSA